MCTDNPHIQTFTLVSGSNMLRTCSISCLPRSGESRLAAYGDLVVCYKGQKIANRVRLCGEIRLCKLCLIYRLSCEVRWSPVRPVPYAPFHRVVWKEVAIAYARYMALQCHWSSKSTKLWAYCSTMS